MKHKIILTLLAVTLFTGFSFSQNKKTIGLSGSIQSNQFGILLPIRLSKRFVLAPAFNFQFVEKVGTDFCVGLAPRYYFKNETLATYIGMKVGVLINIPSTKNQINDETLVDYIAGLAFGAEYFLAENFSLGVEAQGNFTKSDKNSIRFGNPDGLNFNTATMISATIYF